MGSVLPINHRISVLFILHSPYCGTLHIGNNDEGEQQGVWIDQMKLQKVRGRSLDDDGEQFQIFLIDEKTGKGKWMFAQNIDFE